MLDFFYHFSLIFPFETDCVTPHQEHELRISSLEGALGGLTERSEVFMHLTFHFCPSSAVSLTKVSRRPASTSRAVWRCCRGAFAAVLCETEEQRF